MTLTLDSKGRARMRLIALIIFISSLYGQLSAAADIKKWVDKNGRTQYGERPPAEADTSPIADKISIVEVNTINPTATLYSTRRCGYCKKAKAFMSANNINYREYDIEEDSLARAKFKKLGGTGVPLIEHQGRVLYGFNKDRYKRFFGI